jgi:DNA-3-methyladenine glycosylase I
VASDEGVVVGDDGKARCWWAGSDPLYRPYHDDEWGRPVADDRRLFEKLNLEGFMSGLSWLTILRKREHFRRAFAGFDPEAVARFTEADEERLMNDSGVVRNRAKIAATINNARRYQDLKSEFGSLAAYAWAYEAPRRQRLLDRDALMQIKFSPEAAAMSKDLRKRGWAFVGPTTVYSFMQAVGIVNDHLRRCHVGAQVEEQRAVFVRPLPAGPGGSAGEREARGRSGLLEEP